MKRIISICLCIALVIALCPAITASAEGSAKIDLSGYTASKVVTASASYESGTLGKAALIDGVDDNFNSRFIGLDAKDLETPFVTTWIQLDLQKVYTVDKLSFNSSAGSSGAGLPKDFTIEVSTDGTQWTTVYTKTGQAAVPGTLYTYEFTATDARYVKLNVTAIVRTSDANLGNCLSLRELSVYGVEKVGSGKIDLSTATVADIGDVIFTGEAACPQPVVTLGGTTLQKDVDYTLSYQNNDQVGTGKVIITGMGNYEGTLEAEFTIVENTPQSEKIDLTGYVSGMTSASNFAQSVVSASASYEKYGIGVAALIDGDTSTRFAGISETDKTAGATFKETWIQLDLKKIYTVDKLSFTANATASSAGLPKDFTVQVSENGTTWTTVYTKTGLAAVASVNQFSFDFTAVDARYVKLNVTAIGRACDVGDCVCLKELEVYGVEKESEVPELKFSYAVPVLANDLAIEFQAKGELFGEGKYTNPTASFTFNGKTVTADLTYNSENDRYVCLFTGIAPHQMGDEITYTLSATYDGETVTSVAKTYSMLQYCTKELENSPSAKLEALLVSTLNYGAAAQTYSGYKTTSLVNAGLTSEQQAVAAPELGKVTNTGENNKEQQAVWKTATVILDNAIVTEFKFQSELSNLTVKINGSTDYVTVVAGENNMYTVYYEGLNAAQLSNSIEAVVYSDGEAVSSTLTYSVESCAYYHVNENPNASDALKALVNAMMVYGNAAKDLGN